MKSILFCRFIVAGVIGSAVWGYLAKESVAADRGPSSTVHGRVVLAGQAPTPELIRVYRDSGVCGEVIEEEGILMDPTTRGIAGVVVSLEGVEGSGPSAAKDITIESDHCRFVPRVNATTIQSTATFRNRDPILHDALLLKPNRFKPIVLNVMQPPRAPDVTKSLKEPGIFTLTCNIHSFMHASMLVFDHPYFTITDATGDFTLSEIPAGIYKIRLWHERLGVTEKILTVRQGEPTDITIELKKETRVVY